MRLTSLWVTAVSVPTTMVTMAMIHIIGRQSAAKPGSAT